MIKMKNENCCSVFFFFDPIIEDVVTCDGVRIRFVRKLHILIEMYDIYSGRLEKKIGNRVSTLNLNN